MGLSCSKSDDIDIIHTTDTQQTSQLIYTEDPIENKTYNDNKINEDYEEYYDEDIDEKNKITHCKHDTLCTHYQLIQSYNYSIESLYHLQTLRHNKTLCKYGQKCNAYKRLINNGYRMDDRCHMTIYKHPPRMNHGTNTDWKQLNFVRCEKGGNSYYSKYKLTTSKPGSLQKEVIKNGYKYILYPTSGKYQHLNEIVNEKLNHPYHKSIGSPLSFDEMLSIILYTGTDAYKDLRDTEMNGNYIKWKHFRINLANSIHKLPSVTNNELDGTDIVYHGLHKVSGSNRYSGWWESCTVISTSLDKNVALQFAKNEGSILMFPLIGQFGPTFSNADVSWISKFEDEKEVLILPDSGCFVAERDKINNSIQQYFVATEE